ncbi:uncharacterized protein LOC119558061 [Drosophila subpulchrella]|uniref:uncharacterized protein LOC119558061 n=1 Tax=Drosophila subpulchrella TaxID=1486046 RepID=UPI0018A176BA|nr:uncharacterized protein LOC119558061 [Drosophila subpulchrella]
MPNPPKSYLLRLVILLATINLARMAPRQVIPLDLKELLGGFNFPEPQEKNQEIPEPRGLYVNLDVGQDGQQDELQQVLLVTSGLSPTQIVQRQADDQNLRNQGRHFFKNGATVFVFSGMNSGGITNNNTNNINTNATATPAAASTTATRNTEFIRAPIGYPAGLPMQYFRKRQDDALSPAVSYPDLFGWNEAAFYGGDLGGGYAGLGGLNGGYSPLAGVPLVPITIGNEVRYIPMNLRMYRQLARSPAPPPPAIREQDDQLEEDDMSAFGLAPQLDVMELEDVEQADEAAQGQGQGHSVAGSPGYGILGQRLRPRPLVRRRPLQSLAQNIRRVQYLKR